MKKAGEIEVVPPYSMGKTVWKGVQHVLMLAASAAIVTGAEVIGDALAHPEFITMDMPEGYALVLVPLLSAAGESLRNWAKHRKQ